MLAALAQTATDLGVGLLIACCLFGLAVLIGRCIHGAEEDPEFTPPDEPTEPADLDDWLGRDGLDFDFKVYRQPEASVRVGGFDGLR